MTYKTFRFTLTLTALCLMLNMLGASLGLAENRWIDFTSKTGIYRVKIPNEYKTETNSLRFNNDSVLSSEETVSTIDQRPYKNAVKNYIIKMDQSLGQALSDAEINAAIDREIQIYADHYKQQGGVVKSHEDFESGNMKGTELYLAYDDPDLGLQGVRARILFADVTRIQQILTGPEHAMHTVESKDFFDSLQIAAGVTGDTRDIKKEWVEHTSPMNLSTFWLPPRGTPYVPEEPTIQTTDKAEAINFRFYDPVRSQYLYYNMYGYRLNGILTYKNAQAVLLQYHVTKHLGAIKNVGFSKGTAGNAALLETEYAITPPEGFPYLRDVKLRALFSGNYMVVQEIMGDYPLVKSMFVNTLYNTLEFHPETAGQTPKAATSDAPATP